MRQAARVPAGTPWCCVLYTGCFPLAAHRGQAVRACAAWPLYSGKLIIVQTAGLDRVACRRGRRRLAGRLPGERPLRRWRWRGVDPCSREINQASTAAGRYQMSLPTGRKAAQCPAFANGAAWLERDAARQRAALPKADRERCSWRLGRARPAPQQRCSRWRCAARRRQPHWRSRTC